MHEQPPALVEVAACGGRLDALVQRRERAQPLGAAGRQVQLEGGSRANNAEHKGHPSQLRRKDPSRG
eukprot:scaffold60637_cov30-Phaeocystis_antarctica.AAC.1